MLDLTPLSWDEAQAFIVHESVILYAQKKLANYLEKSVRKHLRKNNTPQLRAAIKHDINEVLNNCEEVSHHEVIELNSTFLRITAQIDLPFTQHVSFNLNLI